MIKIPDQKALSEGENSSENVATFSVKADGALLDGTASSKISFFPTGKLGSLKGGMLSLNDFRAPLNADDIRGMAVDDTKKRLEKKRTF